MGVKKAGDQRARLGATGIRQAVTADGRKVLNAVLLLQQLCLAAVKFASIQTSPQGASCISPDMDACGRVWVRSCCAINHADAVSARSECCERLRSHQHNTAAFSTCMVQEH